MGITRKEFNVGITYIAKMILYGLIICIVGSLFTGLGSSYVYNKIQGEKANKTTSIEIAVGVPTAIIVIILGYIVWYLFD